MELHGTQCYCGAWRTHGRRDPCRQVQQPRSSKPSHAIACSLQRKPIPPSFVRDCSAWPAIGCGRLWKRTRRRHHLIALCGVGGFSPHAARLERARELVLCGVDFRCFFAQDIGTALTGFGELDDLGDGLSDCDSRRIKSAVCCDKNKQQDSITFKPRWPSRSTGQHPGGSHHGHHECLRLVRTRQLGQG
jgi:hypothetical protein